MKLLAIETATTACSVAVYCGGNITESYQIAPQKHTQIILPMIEQLLQETGINTTDLTALAFGCGPGSFTGVRIAAGIIQGIAFGLDLPVIPISTLASLAQAYFDQHPENLAYVAMDARMSEIYWGIYQRNHQGYAQLVGSESVTPPELIKIPEVNSAGIGIGSGFAVYADILKEKLSHRLIDYHPDCLPRASAIAKLGVYGFNNGQAVTAEHTLPNYLRNDVAKKESER